MKSPGFFGKALYGKITPITGEKPGTPPDWTLDGDRLNIHSGNEFKTKVVPWEGSATFTSTGGEKEITWTLGSIMTGSGSSFNIKKSDFGDDGKIKEPKKYKLIATDEHGATDSMNVIIAKVKIKPFLMNIVESINSKKFTCEVLPKGIKPDSYKWLLKGAFPANAVFPTYKRQGKPKLEYATPDEKQTIVKQTRWFAKTGNRLMSVDGLRVGYTINCEVKINGQKIRAKVPQLGSLVVTAKIEGKTVMNAVTGHPIPYKKHNEKWAFKRGTLKRGSPKITKLPLKSSQWFDKKQAHENHHVKQWNEIAPWKDLYDIDTWWELYFKDMEADSNIELNKMFEKKIRELLLNDTKIYKKNIVKSELEAWHIDNALPPDFLEMTDKEIKKLYGGQ